MKTKKLLISREYLDKETLGYGAVFDGLTKVFEFNTIELPNIVIPLRINTRNTNCIPEGIYEAKKIYSPTKGKCFEIQDVPDRTHVLIHVGNYATGKKIDTQGCILVGSNFKDINNDGNLDVENSKDTLTSLLDILPNKFKLVII